MTSKAETRAAGSEPAATETAQDLGASVTELLRRGAARHGDRVAYVFLADGGGEVHLTYAELVRRVSALAAGLTRRAAADERALLLYPPGLDYVTAFLACLTAGVVAVPAYPPRGARLLPRLQAILDDAAPAVVLTEGRTERAVARLLASTPRWRDLPVWVTDAAPAHGWQPPADGWQPPVVSGQDLAFLQYTSGSTSTPKGVEVRHRDLLANQRLIQQAFVTTADAVVVSWLPLYHDMGLIGGMLHSLYLEARAVLMSPQHFLQRPGRWLHAITHHRATVSGAPDFAYDLCARQVPADEQEGLDLRAWQVAFNGAEPVRAATLDRFAAAFGAHGFSAAAFQPCYGLAEATLMVSAGKPTPAAAPTVLTADPAALAADRFVRAADDDDAAAGAAAERGTRLVSSGRPAPGLTVRIVDPGNGSERRDGEVGEVWVRGPGVTSGYWRREAESAETFGGRLAGEDRDDGKDGYLRTGDLGFLLEGELFVTGRLKDLIIVRGRNLYPQDVEAVAAASHPALRPSGGAAFAVEAGGEERLVVVQELELRARADLDEATSAVRRGVAEAFELRPYAVVLIRGGTLPRTSSGKVQRRACRDRFLAGELATVHAWQEDDASTVPAGRERQPPRTPAEERVAAAWSEVLGLDLDRVGVDEPFFAAGGDSVRAAQLLARLEATWGAAPSLDAFLEQPTVAALAAALEASTAASPVLPLLPVSSEAPETDSETDSGTDPGTPLSSSQRRLWFLDQLTPGNPAYNLAVALHFGGDLDPRRLAAALTAVVARHDSLRTTFQVAGGEPRQTVAPPAPVPLPRVDLGALPADLRQMAASRAAVRLAALPFDLGRGPLLRAVLVRLAPRQHALVLALHHAVSDGWSLGVVARELTTLYDAGPDALAPLPVQYGDYARWQRRWLESEAAAEGVAYWRRRLAALPPALELPADRPRPAVQSFHGAYFHRPLGRPHVVEALAAWGRSRGATLFMTLLAAFQALLHRLTGESDLVVGTATSGRDQLALEPLVGFFVNTVALRTAVAGEVTGAELLARARRTALDAFRHQQVPFERVVDELRLRRDLSHTAVVQVMLVLHNVPLTPAPPAGLTLAVEEVDNGTARFDLALTWRAVDDGLLATWKYNRDLFDPATIARFAGHLERLAAALGADPATRVADLPLLSPAARHQLTDEWNDTAVDRWPVAPWHGRAERDESLHQIIVAQAGRTPEGVALIFAGSALSYGELARQSARLATSLRRLGVGPETLVAVLMVRSLELLVALLATLRAGGAYLPLDPSYPGERLRFMRDDARAPVLLTQRRLRDLLPGAAESRVRVVCVDEPAAWPAGTPADAAGVDLPVDPGHPAYVIYTSGSTGRPKGAVLSHRGIVNRLRWMQTAYPLVLGEGVLQKTPVSFDVSVWELFWPLMVGARLIVTRPEGHRDTAYLARQIRDQRATTLHFVPSMLQAFLAEPAIAGLTGLRRVIASGEALSSELQQRFGERLGAELHNLYGPTEASVDVSFWPCRPGERTPVPIGRPIANTTLCVLDRHGRSVPPGVAGELHIGGVGLARGYLARPALTAARFVPDPHGHGERLYRTGDLARLHPRGWIEYLGRIDHQVKVRGFRIELGEVEAALASHPAVRDAVVVAVEARLVAFVVAHPGAAVDDGELRPFLLQRLPEHMVPAALVALAELPLTPSGKADRRALAALAPSSATRADGPGATPAGEVERRLAALWQEQLGVATVGRDDDFFALGGDSIRGALFVNRLQQELGAVIYVMALFDAPTVARFARYLETEYATALVTAGWVAAGWVAADGAAPAPHDRAELGSEGAGGDDLERARRVLAAGFSSTAALESGAARNPSAVFVLAPFRSGTTLLRVMLAGHPRLFAPPELELLGFTTAGERRRLLDGRTRFAREGLLRAVMELHGCDAAGAEEVMRGYEEPDVSIQEVYRHLQHRIGDRRLVDKTPRYALDLPTLERAEAWFEDALYVHLVRHPAATVFSHVEARLDQVYPLPFPPQRQAELIWRLAHRNVLTFLARVPAERQLRLPYEELVRDPRAAVESLCTFFGVDPDPAMLRPYAGGRMTDGVVAGGRMMGDPTFHQHQRIDPAVADRWRQAYTDVELATLFDDATWELAAELGYERPAGARASAAAPARANRPHPLPRDGELPLSFAQERLWFLDRLEGGSATYDMPAAVRLRGALAVPALGRALTAVAERHEVLRTAFPARRGQPAVVVAPPAAVALPVVDLHGLTGSRRERELARRVLAEARRPFDLAAGPLWRAALLRIEADEHVLTVNLHHVVSDGWSVGVLIREVATLYAAALAGDPHPDLPTLPVQYADYAAWQRRWLTGPVLAEHLAYWRRTLAGLPPSLELPADRPRPAVQSFRGGRTPVRVAAPLAARLAGVARGLGATPFAVLLASFAALLHRYGAGVDLAIGVPVAGRNRAEIEPLIGFFVNTVVVRTDLAGDPAGSRLIERARAAWASASRHDELPFSKVVEALSPDRSLSHAPLVQVLFAFQNAPLPALTLPGLALEPLEVDNHTAKFELTLSLLAGAEGRDLTGFVESNRDLFDAATAARLARHWLTLLAALVADPARPLHELPLLTSAERQQLAREWQDSAAPAAGGEGVVSDRVTARALRAPDAVAVSCDAAHLTGGALVRRGRALAVRLRAAGAGPETVVALAVDRSPEMVVALFAASAAGAAYLPLDPTHPPERLAFQLADAGTTVLVTEERLVESLPQGAWTRLLIDAPAVAAIAATAVAAAGAEPGNLAYVIYTSGSTGRPKGVGVEHRALLNLLASVARQPGLGRDGVVLSVTTLSFDVATPDLYLPLVAGVRVDVAPAARVADGGWLRRRLAAIRATALTATPATWRLLTEAGWQSPPGFTAVSTGEPLPAELAARLLAGRGRLWNLYGPTETTVWSAALAVDRAEPVPLGRPVDNTRLWLLDRHLAPVPIGVTGELYVGGAGLARGYLGRPALTAERFLPDPLCATPGERLYLTGDLIRYRVDGTWAFVGRRDHQVKVRGFRIELGEVEKTLAAHPGVAQAVVAVLDDGRGDHRLIAYVAAAEPRPAASELRAHLRGTLPEYMVPAHFHLLDALPLSPTGKVDRRALAALSTDDRGDATTAYVAPENARQRAVAAIWQEVLGIEKVGVHDNFFDLGGHSLLVSRVHGRLLEELKVELPLLELFRHPTIHALAERLGHERDSADEPAAAVAGALARAEQERQALKRRRQALKRRKGLHG